MSIVKSEVQISGDT